MPFRACRQAFAGRFPQPHGFGRAPTTAQSLAQTQLTMINEQLAMNSIKKVISD